MCSHATPRRSAAATNVESGFVSVDLRALVRAQRALRDMRRADGATEAAAMPVKKI
jgi:hypothetical protein